MENKMSKISDAIGNNYYCSGYMPVSSSTGSESLNINTKTSNLDFNCPPIDDKIAAMNDKIAAMNKKVLETKKRLMKVADSPADKLKISKDEAVKLISSDENNNFSDSKTEYFYSEILPKHVNQLINQEINRPSHYGSKSGQDVIDVAEDFEIINNAYKFNILKYLLRGGKKKDNSELQDMKKIKVYLDRYIKKLES